MTSEIEVIIPVHAMNEAEYWKSVAVWMGDVLAATASHQISLKGVGRGEKMRHARIAQMAADALDGINRPSARDTQDVVKRLRSIPDAPAV